MSGQDGAAPFFPGQATAAAAAATVAAAMLGLTECRPRAMPQTGGASAAAAASAAALAALAAADRPPTWRDRALEDVIDGFMALNCPVPENGIDHTEAGLGVTDQPSADEEADSPRRQEHPSTDGPAAWGEAAAAYDRRIAQLTEALRSAGVPVPSWDPGSAAGDVSDPAPAEPSQGAAEGGQGGAQRESGTEREIEELREALEHAHHGWAAAEAALEDERHQRRVSQQQQDSGGGNPRVTEHVIRRLEAELHEAMQKEADHEEERDDLRAQLEECEDELAECQMELEACERDLAKQRVALNAATRDYDYVLRLNDNLVQMLDEQQAQQAAEQHSRAPAPRHATGRSSLTSVAGQYRYRVRDMHRTPSTVASTGQYRKHGMYRPPPSVASTLSPERAEWLLGGDASQQLSSHS
eukprot:TRINITY_DN7739_c0_g3_i1.p1 TRINITY_DN7739_c0_g3~~TRINITY_DN7739_c0_g3_i1.p1  ORF type:complete len:442 (+),score=145.97 TRINITY_DN7739_c0_g3_i1:89-1327(+)